MIEPGGILHVQPSGVLKAGDFERLKQFADAYLEKHGTLAALLIESQAFPGWNSFAGFAAHLRFIREHQRRIDRIAVVTDSSIAQVAELLAEPFARADIRCFPFAQYQAALHWLRSDDRAALTG